MNKLNAIAGLVLLLLHAGSAGTIRTEAFNSSILQKSMAYDIYVPNSYANATRRYPVIYLLHWYGGNKENWGATGIQSLVDTIEAIAVVPSDASTASWWMDSSKNPSQRLCTFLVQDLKRHIDSLYQTDPSKSKTGICGVSMGGYGALNALRRHPDIFGAAFSIVGGVSLFDIASNMYSLPVLLGDRASVDSVNNNQGP
jgi:S-formylglutathione hydrolase FrmB